MVGAGCVGHTCDLRNDGGDAGGRRFTQDCGVELGADYGVVDEGLAELIGRDADPSALAFFDAEVSAGIFDRQLPEDYEFLTQTSETMIRVAMIHLMVRRLARMGPY